MLSIQECLLLTAKSFHFFRRLKFFTHFTSFSTTDFNIQHTHITLWDLPKNTLRSRETETHNHLLSTELIRERMGWKKLLQIIFVCRQNAYLQISYSDRKRNHLPRDPLGAYARLYPWTWDAPQHLMFPVIQDNWQNKNVHYRIHTVAHLCLGSADLSPSGKWLTNTSELNWRVVGEHKSYLIRSSWQQILRPCTIR